jgi:hypothetical protein
MDKKETNKLQNEAGLEETLTDAVIPAAEPSESENTVLMSNDLPAEPKTEEKSESNSEGQVNEPVPAIMPETEPIDEIPEKSEEKVQSENAEPETIKEVRKKRVPKTVKVEVTTDTVKNDEESVPAEPAEEKVPNKVKTAEPSYAQVPTTRDEVVEQLRSLISGIDDDIKDKIDFLKQTFYKIQKAETDSEKKPQGEEIAPEEQSASQPDSLEAELKELLNSWREKRAGKIAEQEKQRLSNLEKKLQIIESIKTITDSSEDIGKTLPEFRHLQQEWKETGNIPQEQVNEVWKKYQIQVERFYDLLKINNEFREYDFKKNLEIKTNLCESAEKLADENDVVIAFRQLQKMHEDWRETGPVAKEFREDIWNRFKNASSVINKKHQHFFERLKSAENENLTLKTAICETVEAIDLSQLKSYKDWDTKTADIIQLQEQWKSIGFAPKKVNNRIFDRFRAACDAFFQQKSDFYKASKEILNQNLEKKKQLCEKAESLKESTDWKTTSETLIQIQREWKSIGPVPKKLSDSIWNRFILACDHFFEQKEKFAPSQKNEEMRNLAAKKELIAQLENLPEDMPEEEAVKLYKDLLNRWNATGYVPFKEKDKVYKAWHEAVDKQTEHLNINKENRRLNKFQHNLEDMNQKGQGKVLYERERLLRQFDNISSEIKTAENNIGFFTMSKSSNNTLMNDMKKKIDALKEERDLIYKKIKLIDEQL